MPPEAKLFMSEKSAYTTSVIFLEWLNSTNCNSVEMRLITSNP